MFQKSFLILLLVSPTLSGSGTIMAQDKKTPNQVLDTAQIRVLYEVQKEADKKNEKIILTDTMALNIGQKWSEYYDWHKTKLDSLLEVAHEMVGPTSSLDNDDLNARIAAGAEVYKLPRDPETARIYKERTTQKITTIDNGPFDMTKEAYTYLYLEEKIPPMDWVISTDTATVLGYVCTRASSNFRGRTYNVWFTPEIPINEGPWKLYGLPGLILKAETTDGIFQFRAIGLEHVENVSIAFPKDKNLVPAKNLKQITDYKKNMQESAEVILVYGKRALSYYTENPIKYPEIELDK